MTLLTPGVTNSKFFPRSINTESNIEVVGIKEMITNLRSSWLLKKFVLPAIWRRANAQSVSFKTLHIGQFKLSTQLLNQNYLVLVILACSKHSVCNMKSNSKIMVCGSGWAKKPDKFWLYVTPPRPFLLSCYWCTAFLFLRFTTLIPGTGYSDTRLS